jgi:hypothetical protein
MPKTKVKKFDGIIISVTGYRWHPGNRYIRDTLTHQEFIQFQIYMANQLKKEIVRAIDTQRYKRYVRKWPPLSISYLKYKKKAGLSTNIWEATGHLRNNIQVFKRENFLVVGFKKTQMYPQTLLQFNKVAKYVEYGGVKLPPRPLFRAITEYVRKNLDDYFKKFKKEVLNKS